MSHRAGAGQRKSLLNNCQQARQWILKKFAVTFLRVYLFILFPCQRGNVTRVIVWHVTVDTCPSVMHKSGHPIILITICYVALVMTLTWDLINVSCTNNPKKSFILYKILTLEKIFSANFLLLHCWSSELTKLVPSWHHQTLGQSSNYLWIIEHITRTWVMRPNCHLMGLPNIQHHPSLPFTNIIACWHD